jgi:hypothetical protein
VKRSELAPAISIKGGDAYADAGDNNAYGRELPELLHFFLSAEPEHHFFALLDAKKVYSVNRFLKEVMPITSSFKIVPVQRTEDLMSVWQMMEK